MIDFIRNIARDAGRLSLEASDKRRNVDFKGERDLVTEVDRMVEDHIISQIKERWPDHDIFGEETGRTSRHSDYCWIIDPIDGTTSFFHDQPFYAVSIALEHCEEIVAGAVFAPKLGELYWAEKGSGAFVNDTPIRVSGTDTLINALFATGFACLRGNITPNNLVYLNRILPNIRDIRRFGSAAIDLCYVACGRLDGFWEMNLNPYDVAAGALILNEAGGTVTDFQGGRAFPEKGILATNSLVHPPMLDLLS